MTDVIMNGLNSIPNLHRGAEINKGYSKLRAFSYEKGSSLYGGHEYVLYDANNKHSESIHIFKITEGKGRVYLHGVTEYRDNQLEGGSVTVAKNGIIVGEDTIGAVQEAWDFITSDFGELQPQTPQAK